MGRCVDTIRGGTMIEDLKRIETEIQKYITEEDEEGGHNDADKLLTKLVRLLSERCYDDEKACVERICTAYTTATKGKWWCA
jgi:hypothetical protein